MKKSLFLPIVLLIVSCNMMREVKPSVASNIEPGTEVPFTKISNAAFAENYIGADVVVECQFLSNSSTGAQYTISKIPNGYFAFTVCDPSVDVSSDDPFSGASVGLPVIVPLEHSDLIFSLKKGDKIRLRGGTYVTKVRGGTLTGTNARYIHFKATSIEKITKKPSVKTK